MYKAQDYTYRVFYSPEDEEYVGEVSEFPSLSVLEDSQEDAFRGIVDAVNFILVDMEKNKETVPVPFSQRAYSGKFSLRIPPSIHRRLDIEAAEEGISLNRLINAKLIER